MDKATGIAVVPAFKYVKAGEVIPEPFMIVLQNAETASTMFYYLGREELYKLQDDIRAIVCDG